MDKIRGTISFVLYPRGDIKQPTDFRIVEFRQLDDQGRISSVIRAKGPIPSGDKEEIIELTGSWVNDKKHGRQFDAVAAEKVLPQTLAGLEVFLARRIKGIGKPTAARITQKFGSATSQVLSQTPERLAELKGISPKAAQQIGLAWKEAQGTSHYTTRVWLAERGISSAYSERIIAHFGGQTTDVLQNNPYRVMEVPRVGFAVADTLALKINWDRNSPERHDAACLHALTEASLEEGHTFLHLNQLLTKMHKRLQVPESASQEAIYRLRDQGKITLDRIQIGPGVVMDIAYAPHLYQAEVRLAKRLAELQSHPHKIHPKLGSALAQAQEKMHLELSPKQVEAIRNVFTYHVSGITGGPGTGKTQTVKALVHAAELLKLRCLMAAPTGRAAKRLSELTGREASTIHRLLKFDPTGYVFQHHRNNPIQADLLIVDEMSMTDLTLARHLFEAVPDNCSVVVIGDSDQLPSVGAGTVLKDMIESKTIRFTVLDSIFRQAQNSDIISNAHRIKRGEEPIFMPKGIASDCHLIPVRSKKVEGKMVDDIDHVKTMLEQLCRHSIPEKLKADPIRDVQVIVPMKIGTGGTRALNETLQNVLNPNGQVVSNNGLRLGDRVMQMNNNYEQDVFNGDIGFVVGYDPADSSITVDFYGKPVEYQPQQLEDIQLAFAQTIHKSQGSQYPVVIVVLLNQHYIMLERNLLYTATTRAQKECIYLASTKALNIACHRYETGNRNSLLKHRLRKAMASKA